MGITPSIGSCADFDVDKGEVQMLAYPFCVLRTLSFQRWNNWKQLAHLSGFGGFARGYLRFARWTFNVNVRQSH